MADHTAPDSTLATFDLTVVSDPKSGCICVQVPDSATLFGTGKAVKVRALVNGHPYEVTMLPVGGGVHMLPLRVAFRRAHELEVGSRVELTLLR